MQRPAAGILAPGTQQVAQGVGNMHPHKHRLIRADVAHHHGQVGGTLNIVPVGAQLEHAIFGIQFVLFHTLHGFLVHGAVVDQVCDGADLKAVLFGKAFQVFTAGHGAIVVHDLADHTGWLATGQGGQVTGGFGVAGTAQYTAGIRHQREDMARLNQVRRLGIARYGSLYGAGAVSGRDAGGDAFTGFDRQRELGAEAGGVLLNHQRQAQLFATLPGHGHADQAAAEPRHKVDGFRRAVFCCHYQVAFVFAIFVVHQDNHLALTDIFDYLFNTVQCHTVPHPVTPALTIEGTEE